MHYPHLSNALAKLKGIAPDAPEWIMSRAEELQRQNHAQRMEEMHKRYSPLRLEFWKGVFKQVATGISFDMDTRKNSYRDFMKRDNSLPSSFEHTFEMMRQATGEYVIRNDVPLDSFAPEEQHYLFPNGIPAKNNDLSAQP